MGISVQETESSQPGVTRVHFGNGARAGSERSHLQTGAHSRVNSMPFDVVTGLDMSRRGSGHGSFGGFAGLPPAPCCEAGCRLMSWEALPGLARAGFSTEVVLCLPGTSGEPFHSILPSLPPQPGCFLPPCALQVTAMLTPKSEEPAGGTEPPRHLAGQHPACHGEGRAHGPHPGPPWERGFSTYPTKTVCQVGQT